MWVSVAGWEVRRPWSGGGGSVLRNTEGGRLWNEGGERGCRWQAGRCGGSEVEAAAARWRRWQHIVKQGERLAME